MVAYAADGGQVTDNYDAAGHKMQEFVAAANGDRSTIAYDGAGHQTLRQDVSARGVHTSWTYNAAGAAATMSVVNPDGSGEWDDYGVTGRSYTSDRYVYGAGQSLQSITRYHADGTLDSTAIFNANGGQINATYNAAGYKLQELVSGGTGADRFVMSYGNADRINGFNAGEGDKIDLSHVDAISSNQAGSLDHFTLSPGSSLTGQAGQVVIVQDYAFLDGMHWLVEGDTVGNGHADYVLYVTTTGAHTLGASDFIFG